jgi:hypothetical protein
MTSKEENMLERLERARLSLAGSLFAVTAVGVVSKHTIAGDLIAATVGFVAAFMLQSILQSKEEGEGG